MTDSSVLEGIVSIRAALDSQSRPIERLLIRRDQRDYPVKKLATAAKAVNIPVEQVDETVIGQYAEGKTHGGVIALVGDRRFVSMDALITGVQNPFIVMLDGVEDPFNFGQAIRAFYASGAHGLIVRPRNWLSAASTVARASAGASERMPTAVAETLEEAASFFRSRGVLVAVTDIDRAVSIYDADLTQPLFLVVGGEKRGVTRSFADAADIRLKIPYGRSFNQSLGTTGAASVLAFEVMRQRVKE